MKDHNVQITRQTYNTIAKEYTKKRDKDFIWNIASKYLCRKFLRKITNGPGTILVCGSAGGNSAVYMAKHSKHNIVGIDSSREMVRISKNRAKREKAKNCKFIECDIVDLPLNNKYEGILCDGILYHVPKPELLRVLKKLRTILKPGGVLYANLKIGKGFELQQHPKSYPGHPRAYWFYEKKELESYFRRAKFEFVISVMIIRLFGEKYYEVWAKRR
jgi:ubiquinone/menaquinone biosynthesis C-methylase UbiE